MADLSKTVEIIFQGYDKISDPAKSSIKGLNDLGTAATNIAKPFADLGDKIIHTDEVLAAMAIGGMALAIKAAGDFGKGFNDIVITAGLSGEAVGAFQKDIFDFASGSTESLKDINAALLILIKSNYDTGDSLKILKDAEDLGLATHSSLEGATKTLSAALVGYGKGADDASKFADILFQGSKDGKLNMDDLEGSLGKVVGTANAGKVPFGDLVAAIAALTAQGVPVGDAVTGIGRTIFSIIKPTADATAEANRLGISFDSGALASKGLKGVLGDLELAAGGDVDVFDKFFGSIKGFNTAAILANDTSGIFTKTMHDMGPEGLSSASEAAEDLAKRFGKATDNLGTNIAIVLTLFGQQLTPGLTKDVGALADLFKGIRIAFDEGAFAPVFKLIGEAEGKLETVVKDIAKNLPEALSKVDFSGLIKALQDLGGGLTDMFKGVDLTTPEGLEKAIQLVINAITRLINITGEIVKAFSPFVQKIIDVCSNLEDSDPAFDKMIGQLIALGKAVENVGGTLVALALLFGDASPDTVIGAMTVFKGTVEILWDGIKLIFETAYGIILAGLDTMMKALNIVTFGKFQGEVDTLDKALIENAKSVRNTLADMGDAGTTIAKGFGDVGEAAKGASGQLVLYTNSMTGVPTSVTTKFGIDDVDAFGEIVKFGDALLPMSGTETTTLEIDASHFLFDIGEANAALTGDNGIPLTRDTIIDAKTDPIRKAISDVLDAIKPLTDEEKIVNIFGDNTKAMTSIKDVNDGMTTMTGEKTVDISGNDKDFLAIIQDVNNTAIPNKDVVVTTKPVNLPATKKEIDDAIPALKKLQIETTLDEIMIKSDTDRIRSYLDFKAKVDIADIQANAKIMEEAFKSVGIVVEGISKEMTAAFGLLALTATNPNLDPGQIARWIDLQFDQQQQEIDLQKKLIGAQVKYLEAKAAEGSVIKVTGDGLQPELEAFMWQVLSRVQVRMQGEYEQFLVGIK